MGGQCSLCTEHGQLGPYPGTLSGPCRRTAQTLRRRPPRIIAIPIRPSLPPSNGSPADNIQFPSLPCSQLRYSEQSHSSEATGPSARLAPWFPRRSATRLPSPQSVNFSGRPVENPRHAVLRVQPVPDRTHQGYEDRQEEKLCQDDCCPEGLPCYSHTF